MENKTLLGFIVFSLMSVGTSLAYADISVYQENTPEEQLFLELRNAGEWVSYTYGIGITWLSQPLVESAYGEEFTVEVPFDYGDNGCALFEDGEWKLYQCYMEETHFGDDPPKDPKNPYNLDVDTEDGCLEGYSRDLDNLPMCVPDDVLEKEALEKCYNDTSCPVGLWKDDDGNIVNNQEVIDEQPGDIVNEAPDDAFKCGYDIGLFQDESKFEVPIEIWIDSEGQTHVRLYQDDSVRPDNFTSDEDLAVEACLGQWGLEKQMKFGTGFGVTAVPNSEDIFQHHSDVASGIPPIGQDRVNAEANKDFNNISVKNLICNGFYSHHTKLYYGCDPESGYAHDESLQPEMKSVISDEMAKEINQYNDDGGAKMALDKQRENIFHEMDSLRKQLAGLK